MTRWVSCAAGRGSGGEGASMAEFSGENWFPASRVDTIESGVRNQDLGPSSKPPTPSSRLPTLTEAFVSGLDSANHRRGITVLALLLLIIALVVGGIFLVRYLTSSTS